MTTASKDLQSELSGYKAELQDTQEQLRVLDQVSLIFLRYQSGSNLKFLTRGQFLTDDLSLTIRVCW